MATDNSRFPPVTGSTVHPTSSMRDLPKGATGSPDADGDRDRETAEAVSVHDQQQLPTPVTANSSRGKSRRRKDVQEADDGEHKDKRRRLTKSKPLPLAVPQTTSPSKEPGSGSGSGPSTGESSQSQTSNKKVGHPASSANAAANPPVGFAASREARREEGYDIYGAVPSPVVMGFDFKTIDGEQLKTVRDTLSIKEQQQALIAARRREAAGSSAVPPGTPKESSREPSTYKAWKPSEAPSLSGAVLPTSGGVGRRREKIKDKVEKMSIMTGVSDKDVVPASKSAPLDQRLITQQANFEPPSGSQTALPPKVLPSFSSSFHYLSDPRTAPISHSRTGADAGAPGGGERERSDGHEFARQQQQGYYWRTESRGGPPMGSGRNFTVPGAFPPRFDGPLSPPPPPPLTRPSTQPHSHTHTHTHTHSHTGSPPSSPLQPLSIPSREAFLHPFNALYDSLSSSTTLQHHLSDLVSRVSNLHAEQGVAVQEFRNTAGAAERLLTSLQQSADSLREMVRYEIERKAREDRREMEELKERLRRLEEREK
ncbi:hypothetical protein CND00490 [Cryptococcus deneoformans JEC21]|uniref:Uncharacterized protein n=1 Tax=Cryptococcus deneoformans (strain JEC21 / ATCC MYA-565) TaxID=214684 RepID=Q5KJ64_CRYD1|nr:hypothetical protein CND00490 [Cryptococcus neoformans var. neoformans JEC21]AAW43010.2 hypothetical protein CND00490 [Cryptococcus neoformans var. neoformans JEC21]